MPTDVELSSVYASDSCSIARYAPLPEQLRNEVYLSSFDFTTIFYDIYRCGEYTVFQGPPLFNFRNYIENCTFYREFLRLRGNVIDRSSGTELWVKQELSDIAIECALTNSTSLVQPDLNSVYDGKRVLLTLSKDNDVQWIEDWVRFHVKTHGADAVLIYDNSSNAYSAAELEGEITRSFPSLTVRVVNWPFKFGPQIWRGRDESGRLVRINSKFCQAGALQHARFRFLQKARSVLNCDIDELVSPSKGNRSVFDAAETSLFGAIHFKGQWMEHLSDDDATHSPRHADSTHYDPGDRVGCPQKWAVVPARCARSMTWSAHRVHGLDNYFTRSKRFYFGHFREITTNWKYNRLKRRKHKSVNYEVDIALVDAMQSAGLHKSNTELAGHNAVDR